MITDDELAVLIICVCSSRNLLIKHHLSLKTSLHLALATVKRVGDLQALSVSTSCVEFGHNNCKVILKPRHGYVPKVLSTPFRAQLITLLALPGPEGKHWSALACSNSQSSSSFASEEPQRAAGYKAKTLPLDSGCNSLGLEGLQCP